MAPATRLRGSSGFAAIGSICGCWRFSRVLPISEKTADYAKEVLNLLKIEKLRASVDLSDDKIGAKIKLHPLTFSDVTTKAPLILQSGEKCDLMAMSGFNAPGTGSPLPMGGFT